MSPPQWYSQVEETPTRTAFLFKWGSEGLNGCCFGRGSSLERNNRPYGANGHNFIDEDDMPEFLQGKIDTKMWHEFVMDAKKESGTFPAMCGWCIFSCIATAYCASCFESSAKKNVQQLVEKWDTKFEQHGVTMRYWEKPKGPMLVSKPRGKNHWLGVILEIA